VSPQQWQSALASIAQARNFSSRDPAARTFNRSLPWNKDRIRFQEIDEVFEVFLPDEVFLRDTRRLQHCYDLGYDRSRRDEHIPPLSPRIEHLGRQALRRQKAAHKNVRIKNDPEHGAFSPSRQPHGHRFLCLRGRLGPAVSVPVRSPRTSLPLRNEAFVHRDGNDGCHWSARAFDNDLFPSELTVPRRSENLLLASCAHPLGHDHHLTSNRDA